MVVVPKGRFYLAAVRMWSNTTLYLESGAQLYGSDNCEDYEVFAVPDTVEMRSDMELITQYYGKTWETYRRAIITAHGEENAEVMIVRGPYDAEGIELPYEFELDAGATVKFNVCTTAYMTLTEDEINLVLEKVEDVTPPTSEEPEVPGTSEEPVVPGESEEPEVPGESEEPVVPGESEKTEEDKKDKKKGCGSSLGLGVAGALTAVGAALVIKKRKED